MAARNDKKQWRGPWGFGPRGSVRATSWLQEPYGKKTLARPVPPGRRRRQDRRAVPSVRGVARTGRGTLGLRQRCGAGEGVLSRERKATKEGHAYALGGAEGESMAPGGSIRATSWLQEPWGKKTLARPVPAGEGGRIGGPCRAWAGWREPGGAHLACGSDAARVKACFRGSERRQRRDMLTLSAEPRAKAWHPAGL